MVFKTENEIRQLTSMEEIIVNLMTKGYNFKEIAKKLNRSEGTIHTHRKSIYKKLGVNGKTLAVSKYLTELGI